MSALVFSILLGLAAVWTRARTTTTLLEEFQHIVLADFPSLVMDGAIKPMTIRGTQKVMSIPQIMPVMSALVFSILLGLAAVWTRVW